MKRSLCWSKGDFHHVLTKDFAETNGTKYRKKHCSLQDWLRLGLFLRKAYLIHTNGQKLAVKHWTPGGRLLKRTKGGGVFAPKGISRVMSCFWASVNNQLQRVDYSPVVCERQHLSDFQIPRKIVTGSSAYIKTQPELKKKTKSQNVKKQKRNASLRKQNEKMKYNNEHQTFNYCYHQYIFTSILLLTSTVYGMNHVFKYNWSS